MEGCLLLPLSALRGFSAQTSAELLAYIQGPSVSAVSGPVAPAAFSAGQEPAELSISQVRTFVERCSDKTRSALRAIAEADPAGFKVSAVATSLGLDPATADLRGVWGGITKRVRTVLADPSADLIWWAVDGREWTGRVSHVTHRSLRKAFGLAPA